MRRGWISAAPLACVQRHPPATAQTPHPSPATSAEAEGLGVLFGDVLVATHGMRWGVLTDAYGTALIVAHESTATAFPIETVQ